MKLLAKQALIIAVILIRITASTASAQVPFLRLARTSVRVEVELLQQQNAAQQIQIDQLRADVDALTLKLETNRLATVFMMYSELRRHITLRDASFIDGTLLDEIDGTTTAWSQALQTEVTDKTAIAQALYDGVNAP